MQGRSFECLPKLQRLQIDAEMNGGHGRRIDDDSTQVDLAGLPSSMNTLEVGIEPDTDCSAAQCQAGVRSVPADASWLALLHALGEGA